MRRVLMLATYFPRPGNQTIGNWALSQAQALQRQNLEVEVVSLNPYVPRWLSHGGTAAAYAQCPSVYEWDGLTVHYPRALWYPLPPVKHFEFRAPAVPLSIAWRSAGRFLRDFTARFQPDVIYAHHTAVNGDLARRLNERFGIPYLITDHDFDEISACARLPRRKRHFERIVTQSSCMIAVARRMESAMKSLFPAARTCTVANGTNPIPASIRSTSRPANLAGRVVLFSCGAFYARKGFPLLIEAFARIAPCYPEAILRIAGDGDQRADVEAAIRRHKLEARVELLGFQPNASVLQEMCWADAFVLLGWNEPFATVFSEALSAGKPVLSSNDGGICDVIKDRVHGLLVPPKDIDAAAAALDEIVRDGALRAKLGHAASELFESQLKWDHNAARMKALFEQAISKHPTLEPAVATP